MPLRCKSAHHPQLLDTARARTHHARHARHTSTRCGQPRRGARAACATARSCTPQSRDTAEAAIAHREATGTKVCVTWFRAPSWHRHAILPCPPLPANNAAGTRAGGIPRQRERRAAAHGIPRRGAPPATGATARAACVAADARGRRQGGGPPQARPCAHPPPLWATAWRGRRRAYSGPTTSMTTRPFGHRDPRLPPAALGYGLAGAAQARAETPACLPTPPPRPFRACRVRRGGGVGSVGIEPMIEWGAPSIISDVGGERGAQPPVAWSLRRANSHRRAGTLAPRDRTLGQQGCPQHLSKISPHDAL